MLDVYGATNVAIGVLSIDCFGIDSIEWYEL